MIREDLHNLNELKQSTMRCESFIDNLPQSGSLGSSYINNLNISYRPSQPHSNSKYESRYFESKFETNRDENKFDNSKFQSRNNSLSQRNSIDQDLKMYKKKNEGVFVIESYENGSRFEGMVVNGLKEG